MPTKLDERADLINLINKLNIQDCKKLCVFLVKLEAEREVTKAGKEKVNN